MAPDVDTVHSIVMGKRAVSAGQWPFFALTVGPYRVHSTFYKVISFTTENVGALNARWALFITPESPVRAKLRGLLSKAANKHSRQLIHNVVLQSATMMGTFTVFKDSKQT